MRAIIDRLPTADQIERNKAKIAGFASGAIGTLVLVGMFTVNYQGHGLGERPEPTEQVYTVF